MPIIMISCVTQSIREELAQNLSKKLGCPCLSREELWEQARCMGIPVGRLEMSMIRSRGREERLANEKERYLACLTASLCERAAEGTFVYHGQSGHLLLPGVPHRLRVGVGVPWEARVDDAMEDLGVSYDKAVKYLQQLDEDLDNWVRYVHRVSPSQQDHYDFYVNTENVSIESMSSSICALAELPEFRETPASRKMVADALLSSQARLALALDSRTAHADLGVVAEDGALTVTYMPQDPQIGEIIPEVLGNLQGCRELACTMAETNVVLVQERFSPDQEILKQVLELAPRFGAAVELLRLKPREHARGQAARLEPLPRPKKAPASEADPVGVHEDDPEAAEPVDDGGLSAALEELVAAGRSGGGRTFEGSAAQVVETLQQAKGHSLVVVGDVFLSKPAEARKRETRELAKGLQEGLKIPVVTTEELKARYTFAPRDAVNIVVFSAIVTAIFVLMFRYQEPILDFLGGEMHKRWKVVAAICVGLAVPLVAFSYSRVTSAVLKLVGID